MFNWGELVVKAGCLESEAETAEGARNIFQHQRIAASHMFQTDDTFLCNCVD